ncbi:PREDICTED: uncharacterized protein LOC105367530 isoform X2 [Ceratosolen solmsi marchali]|uniref:Uncharacterized protein LOC105367530 isoform X2 n=1 Tax=Ceratosolen solmsi marchali TaxID=326594 RepID=A0AAJ6YUE2_9HYME|nr:PREDICTED: uncharacterized protein LOC105367530 isoform X2 [Ceratosolen solmsi marchali]
MAFKQITLILKRLKPIQRIVFYATTPMFVHPHPPKKPNDDQKLQFEASNLSYDYLLKQSTINAVNSASEALTVTFTAIETTSKEYRELLTKLIILMNQAILQEVNDSHWDEILLLRSEIQEKKEIIVVTWIMYTKCQKLHLK